MNGLYENASTEEIESLMAETAATMTAEHTDYAMLAGRLVVAQLHSRTKESFSGKQHRVNIK